MNLKTVIVEDERHSLERLKSLLDQFEEIDVVGEAMDGETAVVEIDSKKPNLLFLDIQLPVYNGFEVLERLKHRPHVIFITSYNQFAIKAFEENAVDYLLKPTSAERLRESITRVREKEITADAAFFHQLRSQIFPEFINRFAVKLKEDILIVPAEDVCCFRAEDKVVFLETRDTHLIYDATLKSLESTLDPKKFIRVSKSCIVAVDKIHKFSRYFLGEYLVKLNDKDQTAIKIGRKYLPELRNRFRF